MKIPNQTSAASTRAIKQCPLKSKHREIFQFFVSQFESQNLVSEKKIEIMAIIERKWKTYVYMLLTLWPALFLLMMCAVRCQGTEMSMVGSRLQKALQELKFVKSSPPSAAYMRQWIESTLVQIMACRLYGAKPLCKPMLGYCQLDPREQTSVKF